MVSEQNTRKLPTCSLTHNGGHNDTVSCVNELDSAGSRCHHFFDGQVTEACCPHACVANLFFFFFFNFPGHLPSAVREDTPGLTGEGNKSLSLSTSGQAWLVSAQHRCQRRFSTGARRVRNAHSHASLEAAKTIPN